MMETCNDVSGPLLNSHSHDYKSKLDFFETLFAIAYLKNRFEQHLISHLNIVKAPAPLFLRAERGLNDDLRSVEQPVKFTVADGMKVEIPHSLAKWKRKFLHDHFFKEYEGIVLDLMAIRKDEKCDWIHSNYVDQWDWEMVIPRKDRTIEVVKRFVQRISKALKETEIDLRKMFPALKEKHTEKVFFITTQELEDMYPHLNSKQREDEIARQHRTVCILQIGLDLESGEPHDVRSPDYDDWELNGDFIVWHETHNMSLELSSFGIRVNEVSLQEQLTIAQCNHRENLDYHKMILERKYPYTVGGGIGQSRVAMYLLEKYFIGEVQCSVWPDDILEYCHARGIITL